MTLFIIMIGIIIWAVYASKKAQNNNMGNYDGRYSAGAPRTGNTNYPGMGSYGTPQSYNNTGNRGGYQPAGRTPPTSNSTANSNRMAYRNTSTAQNNYNTEKTRSVSQKYNKLYDSEIYNEESQYTSLYNAGILTREEYIKYRASDKRFR